MQNRLPSSSSSSSSSSSVSSRTTEAMLSTSCSSSSSSTSSQIVKAISGVSTSSSSGVASTNRMHQMSDHFFMLALKMTYEYKDSVRLANTVNRLQLYQDAATATMVNAESAGKGHDAKHEAKHEAKDEAKEEQETPFDFKKAGVRGTSAKLLLSRVDTLIKKHNTKFLVFAERRKRKIANKIHMIASESGMHNCVDYHGNGPDAIHLLRSSLTALSIHLQGGLDSISRLTIEDLALGVVLHDITHSSVELIAYFGGPIEKCQLQLLQLKNSPYSYPKLKALMSPLKEIASRINGGTFRRGLNDNSLFSTPPHEKSFSRDMSLNNWLFIQKQQVILDELTDNSVLATEVASYFESANTLDARARQVIHDLDEIFCGFSIRYRFLIKQFSENPKFYNSFLLLYRCGLLQYDFANDKLLSEVVHYLMQFSHHVITKINDEVLMYLNLSPQQLTLTGLFNDIDSSNIQTSIKNRFCALIFLVMGDKMQKKYISACLPEGSFNSFISNPHGYKLAQAQWLLASIFIDPTSTSRKNRWAQDLWVDTCDQIPMNKLAEDYNMVFKRSPHNAPFTADIALAMNEFFIYRQQLKQPLKQKDLDLLDQNGARAVHIARLICTVLHFKSLNCQLPPTDLGIICGIVADENRFRRLMALVQIALEHELYRDACAFIIMWDYSASKDVLEHFTKAITVVPSEHKDIDKRARARLILERASDLIVISTMSELLGPSSSLSSEARNLMGLPSSMWRAPLPSVIAPIICDYVATSSHTEASPAKKIS